MPEQHPRYPAWFVACAVVALIVAISDVSRSDWSVLGEDAWAMTFLEGVIAWTITFGFWYGVVLGVAWLLRKAKQAPLDSGT